MKRVGFVLLVVGLVCLGTGCASVERVSPFSQNVPIALVSVVSNWDINWKGEEPVNPRLAGTMARRALRTDPDLTLVSNADELINTAERLFREAMARSPLINLAEKETVFLSRAYREARLNRHQVNRGDVSPTGYRLVDFRARNFSPALAAETGIQRVMFVEFNFTKAMRSGFGKNGNGGAEVDMRVLIRDARGNTLYNRTFSLGSQSTIRVADGRYSRSGLIQLFESAIADACFEFLFHLEGTL
jgi:hypothetical protein